MKKIIKPATEKNMDLLISKISVQDILGVHQMICTRGGDGKDILPPPPPPPPTGNSIILVDLTKL